MDLNSEKKLILVKEREQLEICRMLWEKERKLFQSIDIMSHLAKSKNDDDLQILMEAFTDWVSKTLDNPEKNKNYLDFLQAIYRIHSYCFNIETTVNQAAARWHSEIELSKNALNSHSKEKIKYISQIKSLEGQLENAKKQIEFHENNSKRK